MSRIVTSRQLSGTVQMMTRKTVAATVQQAVNHELRQLFGVESVAELPPAKRAEVVRVMEDIGETAELRVALLVDASASMRSKLPSVEEAIRDLALSLKAREGESMVAVFHFPGDATDEPCVMDSDWTHGTDRLRMLTGKLKMRGTTPTGPALLHVLEFFRETCGNIMIEPVQTPSPIKRDDSVEVRSDYVV